MSERLVTLAEANALATLADFLNLIEEGKTMAVHLIFKTDNAAFQDGNGGAEVARILREVASQAEAGMRGTFKLHDENGNTVGSVTLSVPR